MKIESKSARLHTQRTNAQKAILRSYVWMRFWIGLLGFSLPWILVLASAFGMWQAREKGAAGIADCKVWQTSISHYYFTYGGDCFVGTLWFLGAFLLIFRSGSRLENWLSSVAGICAILVSLFPTSTDGVCDAFVDKAMMCEDVRNIVHTGAAIVFFACLAAISLFCFRRKITEGSGEIESRTKNFNSFFLVCGLGILLIVLSLIMLFLVKRLDDLDSWYGLFVLECVMLILFALSWFAKGIQIKAEILSSGPHHPPPTL